MKVWQPVRPDRDSDLALSVITKIVRVLHLHPKSKGSGVVIELAVSDHRAEIDEQLKTIGQHRKAVFRLE